MKGIYAVCSSHPTVLKAAMLTARDDHSHLLIEATPNQVNQFGGYSGMTPIQFRRMVEALASNCELPPHRLIFGADHLGPHVWRKESAESAMGKAVELTRAFVAAGFTKLHLDAGMPLGDDSGVPLSPDIVVNRTLQMMAAAQEACLEVPDRKKSIAYVIGTEAPTPGGGVEEDHLPVITSPSEIAYFLELCRNELERAGRREIWQRVVGVVMQPGVDFGDRVVIPYDSSKAADLIDFMKTMPPQMTCEVHATDYQSRKTLAALVDEGFRILKVGPCLTFAYRRAVFALASIEADWLAERKSAISSNICKVLEDVMAAHPEHWQSHYRGSPSRLSWLRQFSLRDRIRYYWNYPEVAAALARLIGNLSFQIPQDLLLQHWPDAPSEPPDYYPQTLINHYITEHLRPYADACKVP